MDNGSRIRVNHLLRAFHEKHYIHYIGFIPSSGEWEYLPLLQGLCDQIDVVERDPFWRDPRQRVSAHFSLMPRDVLRGYSHEMAAMVRKTANQEAFDVIIASTLEVAQYALLVKNSPRILEEHNFSTLWMHERLAFQSNLLRKTAGWITWQKCRRYERQLYSQFQAVTMVSERDRKAVQISMPDYAGQLTVIPNGVDIKSRYLGVTDPVPDTIIFNGSLTYSANREAMQFFISQIWPLICKEHKSVRLRITGRMDGVDLGWLPDDPQIELTGYMEDVRPAVAGSWLAVAPLRSGGGTRLKILEAMALGTPVVATSKGAEGLEVKHGQDILIADEPRQFVGHCLRLLESPTLREELANNARRLVEQSYGWDAIGDKFCRLVESIASGAKSTSSQ